MASHRFYWLNMEGYSKRGEHQDCSDDLDAVMRTGTACFSALFAGVEKRPMVRANVSCGRFRWFVDFSQLCPGDAWAVI
jgi:hypothetical protein